MLYRWRHRAAVFLTALVVLGSLTASCLAQSAVVGVQPAGDEDPKFEISKWIEQLDDDQFLARRNATDKLISSGAAAIGPVARAMAGSNREVAMRGVYVLHEIALNSDVSTQEAALKALRQLADSPTKPASRLAEDAIKSLVGARQQRTVKQLHLLGAKIQQTRQIVGTNSVPWISVEINQQWEGTVDDLHQLKWLPNVRKISFIGQRVNDQWIQPIEYLTQLEYLVIRHARITDAALKSVSKARELAFVELLYTPVSNAGLGYLKTSSKLRYIKCYGTAVSHEAAEQFRKEFAHVEFDHKNGAYMGVLCQQPPWPCEVTNVLPDTAAARAGVKPGDFIVRYRGEEIDNFDGLKAMISRNKSGDSVVIQVARGKATRVIVPQIAGQSLGIEGQKTPFGCKVTKVLSDGVAIKGGIRAGDVIAEISQFPITDLKELHDAYAQATDAGRVELQVIRNTKILSLKVTFGEWN